MVAIVDLNDVNTGLDLHVLYLNFYLGRYFLLNPDRTSIEVGSEGMAEHVLTRSERKQKKALTRDEMQAITTRFEGQRQLRATYLEDQNKILFERIAA